jgi:hypothetical protein
MPYATKAALPVSVRYYHPYYAPAGIASAAATYDYLYIDVAVLIQGVVAVVVAARARRHRPALTVLAASLTAALATLALFGVNWPIDRCIHVFSAKSGACLADHALTFSFAATTLGQITVEGIILAVPAALAGAAIGAWRRRPGRPPPGSTPAASTTRLPARPRTRSSGPQP